MRKFFFFLFVSSSFALSQGGPRPEDLTASPQAVGEPGVFWYTTWDTALAEAKRSQRPIFFMAAAATCNGVPGVFWPGYTATQNSLFSQDDFIAASRDFVCVRLESYESKEHQELIRTFLRGAFANTAFCILGPDGEKRLSKSGRGPSSLLGRRGGAADDSEAVIKALKKIAADYSSEGSTRDAVVQDFHTSRQALNVAAGDQRLLLLTVSGEKERDSASKTLKAVLNDPELVGRFHHDFAEKDSDAGWRELLTGEESQTGYFVVQADSFGQKGQVLAELPLSAKDSMLKKALKEANVAFAKAEVRKVYRQHVREGRRKGAYFENGMPYGEDRDGDGVIDEKRGRKQR